MADGAAHREWFTSVELAGLPGVPTTERRVREQAKRDGWKHRDREGRGGGREYHLTSLPVATQAALLRRAELPASIAAAVASAPRSRVIQHDQAYIEAAHERYARGSDKQRAEANAAAVAVATVQHLVSTGMPLMKARDMVAAQMRADGAKGATSPTIARWQRDVGNAPRANWPALLMPGYTGRTVSAECHPSAWDWFVAEYLTQKCQSIEGTYDRLVREVVPATGWAPIPCARTFARRIARMSPYVVTLLRHGAEEAAKLIPPQRRDVSCFAAGEAVCGDGLKFDRLWVRFEDGEIVNTATAWFWQDLNTRRQLAWRLDKTENTDMFRLATYDLTGVCAPSFVYIDNTRVAANKLMTAGAGNRHRFKADPEEGIGLLKMLGMEPRFTNPDKEYGNPGAKPIERAFGIGGIHEMVATNPRFTDRGYSKATAIDVAELREVIAHELARFNSKPERRTQMCGGVLSFDQAWADGIAKRPPRVLTESQRRLLLMCREVVTVNRRHGEIVIKAGANRLGVNAYWSEALLRYSGQKVVAMFDPQDLTKDLHVYALSGQYLCRAEHRPTQAFNNTAAGRENSKFKARAIKAGKAQADAERRMSALEAAAIYEAATASKAPPPEPQQSDSKVVHGHFNVVPNPERDAQRAAATGTDGPSELDLLMLERMRERKRRHDAGEF